MIDPADEEIPVDPGDAEFESGSDLADRVTIRPLLGLIARSARSALEVLELDHLRILMLLSQRDAISVAELSRLTTLPARKLAIVLDAMESAEWVTTSRPARGIGEMVAISGPGSELAGQVIRKRQDEIDDILARMSDEDRGRLARAFSSFAIAASEPTLRQPRVGLQP